MEIPADTSEWELTDINDDGIIIAHTQSVCTGDSPLISGCGRTFHKYNTNTGEYKQDSVLYYMTGYSNEALQLVGKVNEKINIFTGRGESTGLLATPK